MTTLPIVKGYLTESAATRPALSPLQMPLNYMSDFSVMGLSVSDCDAAVRILAAHNFPVIRDRNQSRVRINSLQQVPRIVQLLRNDHITCEYSDIADQIYQG